MGEYLKINPFARKAHAGKEGGLRCCKNILSPVIFGTYSIIATCLCG